MSTQQELYGKGYSNAQKTFKYVLSSSDYGQKVLHYTPEGWDESELTFIRDPKYKGVLETFSTNSLKFEKDGRDYIQTAYNKKGIDYEITVTIYILNTSLFQYAEYFVGKLDLSTYSEDSISVSCEIINTGFQNRVLNRDNIDVDLLNTKFIGGGENSMAQISGMPSTLILPVYSAEINADWGLGTTDPFPGSQIPAGDFAHYVPMLVNSTEFENGEAGNQEYDTTTPFFTASQDRDINLSGAVTVYFQTQLAGWSADWEYELILRQNNTIIDSQTKSVISAEIAQIEFTLDDDISLVSGDVLTLRGTANGTADYYFDIVVMDIATSQDTGDTLPSVNVESFNVFEFVARILQLTSGNVNPLDSDLLGRTDSSPTSYAEDGDFSLVNMTNGRLIRGFASDQITFNGSLKGAFKTIDSIKNIGLGFENNKVKIEEEAYFFDITDNPSYPSESEFYQTNQILDFSEGNTDPNTKGEVTTEVIKKDVLQDWYHNEVKSGYKKFEYETFQGLKEFNTKSLYATSIQSVKSTLDLVSDYRFDTQGVNKQRTKPQSEYSTEDVPGDNDVFGFDVKRTLSDFTAKTDEDFTFVSGGVDPSQSYNIDFTPRRNVERHGNKFRSMRLAIGDEIQWMQSDKNTRLVTRKIGETVNKYENGDIVVNDLDLGYWIPESYSFEAPVTENTIAAIQANPYGVIKIADDKYGWILEVQSNNENNKGQFKLLRVELDNVKVVI